MFCITNFMGWLRFQRRDEIRPLLEFHMTPLMFSSDPCKCPGCEAFLTGLLEHGRPTPTQNQGGPGEQ